VEHQHLKYFPTLSFFASQCKDMLYTWYSVRDTFEIRNTNS